jgi:hypothetical protein
MPHLVACRTKDDHRDVDRVAAGVAADVLSSHPRNPSVRLHSRSARQHSVTPDAARRATRARAWTDDRPGAVPHVRGPCVLPTRSAQGHRA